MTRLGHVLLLGALAGCAIDDVDEVDGIGVAEQALTAYTPVTFSMADGYYGTSSSGTSCSSSYKMDMAGSEPAEAGTYPVAVWVTGTGGDWNAALAQNLARKLAERGFVAASVQYANGDYPSCTKLTARASCIFNGSNANSAVAKLCARPKADCSKGIVALGISQGSDIASLAKNYDSRARAAYLVSNVIAPSFLNNTSCLKDSATAFTKNEVRAISGQNDEMCKNTDDVRYELTTSTGWSCPSGTWDCLQPDGSGWYIVQNSQIADGTADHCYLLQNGCSGTSADPAYDTGTQPWSSAANLDWLASRVTH